MLFTVVLDASYSKDTSEENIKANIQSVHDAVAEHLETVLKDLQLAQRLETHFGW